MQFTKKEFLRLGAAGHGRALLALQRARETREPLPDWVVPAVLRLCTRNHTYDSQCEPQREPYLVDLLEMLPKHERAKVTSGILAKLQQSSPRSKYDYFQLLLLSGLLAYLGDAEARTTVLESWNKHAKLRQYHDGNSVIIAAGARGYRLVLESAAIEGVPEVGTQFLWYDWHRQAISVIGEHWTEAVWNAAVSEYPRLETMRDELHPWHRKPRSRSPLLSATFTEYYPVLIAAAKREETEMTKLMKRYAPTFTIELPPSRWGEKAPLKELKAAGEALLKERDPLLFLALAWIFYRRGIPFKPELIVDRLESPIRAIRVAAYWMLEPIKSNYVRQIGLRYFSDDDLGHRAAALLVRNYRIGDLALHYERLLSLRGTGENFHDFGRSADKAAAEFLDKRITTSRAAAAERETAKKLLRLLYEETPCSGCRREVYRRMRSQRWLTKEMRAEWELDAVTLEERCPLV